MAFDAHSDLGLQVAVLGSGAVGLSGGTATWLETTSRDAKRSSVRSPIFKSKTRRYWPSCRKKVDNQTRIDMLARLKESVMRQGATLSRRDRRADMPPGPMVHRQA
jgi:hypothetical protein